MEKPKDSLKKPLADRLDLDIGEKSEKARFNKLATFDQIISFLEEKEASLFNEKQKELYHETITAIKETNEILNDKKDSYSAGNVDLLEDTTDMFEPLLIVQKNSPALFIKVWNVIKKDKFVEGYLGLKFLQDSGKETGDKKNAYEVKKNRFLKLIESQYAFQKLYLDNLKKEGDSKHGNVEIQTERLNSLAVFIEYIEQMKNMPKDKSEEALSKRNALLKKIAKEQLKENLGKTDLLESFDKETVQEIRIDMVDFFSKDQSFIEYYDVEDKEEMEENEEMKDEFEIEKVSPKDKFPNLFRLFKKYFDRQNITKILAGEKELKDIEKELKIFFENSQSGPTEYKKLSLFWETIKRLNQKASFNKSEGAEKTKEELIIEELLREKKEEDPLKKAADEKNKKKEAKRKSAEEWLSIAGGSLLGGFCYALKMAIEMPLSLIFFFSEPRLSKKGFDWKGWENVLSGYKPKKEPKKDSKK